ncbi:MAG: hypothetical protein M9958_06170 [Chitinophagales bacterium]|nr:hypothetical protein [Chitinophagales bacterium]
MAKRDYSNLTKNQLLKGNQYIALTDHFNYFIYLIPWFDNQGNKYIALTELPSKTSSSYTSTIGISYIEPHSGVVSVTWSVSSVHNKTKPQRGEIT